MRIERQRDQWPHRTAALNDDLVNRLRGEFSQWAQEGGKINPGDNRRPAPSVLGDRPSRPSRGPIGHWPHIEDFLKERYPAAHRGLEMGLEEAGPVLDGNTIPYLKDVPAYETGSDALATHGYDPKEIAAAMLLLHNGSTPLRGEWSQQDQDRLTDIFTKRQQMQRNYEQRQTTAAVNQDLVDRLENEFYDWHDNESGGLDSEMAPDYDVDRGPISYWPHIENFLNTRYPAAFRGHGAGMEDAGNILDGFTPDEDDDRERTPGDLTPYETGPEAVAKHGYDPAEVAAGMVLLHNQSDPLRGDMAQEDQQRLTDIFQKRQQMQRDYEQRTVTEAVS